MKRTSSWIHPPFVLPRISTRLWTHMRQSCLCTLFEGGGTLVWAHTWREKTCSAPVGQVGKVWEQGLVVFRQSPGLLGRGQHRLLRRELLVKVRHVLHSVLERQKEGSVYLFFHGRMSLSQRWSSAIVLPPAINESLMHFFGALNYSTLAWFRVKSQQVFRNKFFQKINCTY